MPDFIYRFRGIKRISDYIIPSTNRVVSFICNITAIYKSKVEFISIYCDVLARFSYACTGIYSCYQTGEVHTSFNRSISNQNLLSGS